MILTYQHYYLNNLINIERGKGNYRKASDYAERYAVCVDSMYLEKLDNNAAMYQKKYDKTKVELEKAELEVDNKQLETWILLIVIVVGILMILALLYTYRRRIMIANRERAKDEAMSELTDELQGKIIELQELRLRLADRENDVNDSKQEVVALKEQIFEMNAVVQRIKGLKKTKTAELHGKKSVLGEEELAVLMEALDSCYNGVVSRLKETVPNINKDELNLCCLLCLNVPLAKASLLLGASEESLRQRKYRLRHSKMNLAENMTLDEYIEKLKNEIRS